MKLKFFFHTTWQKEEPKNSVFLPNPWQLLCPGRLLRSATSISRRETETSMVFYMVTCRVIPLTWKSLSAFRRIRCWTGSMTAETELTKRLSKIEVTLDLKQILKPCNDLRTHRRGHGFKCSEVNLYRNCLQMASWCAHFPICTCSELNGTTATGKTINPQLCSNQTFWEHTADNFTNYNRCTHRQTWNLSQVALV